MLNKILIGILVAVSFAGYILYNKNQELIALNTALELRDAEQKATIEAIKNNLEKTGKELSGLQIRNQQ